jgi:hypothetical protein
LERAQAYTDRIPTLLLSFPFKALLTTGEIMSFITVAVITALCFVFPTLRIYGVIGTGLLLYFKPYLTLGVMSVVGIAYYFYRRNFA